MSPFSNEADVDAVTVPDGITVLERNSVRGGKTDRLVLPDSLTEIHSWAVHFEEIGELYIPNSVTKIADYAFGACGKIRKLRLPGTLQYLGRNAFNCSGFREIIFSGSRQPVRCDLKHRVFLHIEPGCRIVWPNWQTNLVYWMFDSRELTELAALEADRANPLQFSNMVRAAMVRGYISRILSGGRFRSRQNMDTFQWLTRQYLESYSYIYVNINPRDCMRALILDGALSQEEMDGILAGEDAELKALVLERMKGRGEQGFDAEYRKTFGGGH